MLLFSLASPTRLSGCYFSDGVEWRRVRAHAWLQGPSPISGQFSLLHGLCILLLLWGKDPETSLLEVSSLIDPVLAN